MKEQENRASLFGFMAAGIFLAFLIATFIVNPMAETYFSQQHALNQDPGVVFSAFFSHNSGMQLIPNEYYVIISLTTGLLIGYVLHRVSQMRFEQARRIRLF